MKNIFFSLLLILGNFKIGIAQVNFAPSVGLNFSRTITTQPIYNNGVALPENSFIQGKYVGFLLNFPLPDRWAVQVAAQYSEKGQVAPFVSRKQRFSYIDFLPTLEYRVGKNKHLGISTGLNLGIDFFEQYKNPSDIDWKVPVTNLHYMKRVDVGLLLGIKMYYKKGFVALSYNQSVLDAADIMYTDEQGVELPIKTLNQNLQIGVGYFITNKHK